jgi:hypothetical protein
VGTPSIVNGQCEVLRFVQQHYTWPRALKAFMEVVS